MGLNILNPIIIKLYLLRVELSCLEDVLNNSNTPDEWPDFYYEDILLMTDRFYRTHNKCLKIFKSTENIDYLMYIFEKRRGIA